MFDNNFGKCGPISKFFINSFVRKFSMHTRQRFPAQL